MKKESNRCSSCSQVFLKTLALDCRHSICPHCLQHLLKEEEKQERLTDELEIECPACTYVTLIAIALAYKIVRPARQAEGGKHSNHCKSMVCMDCLDGCFPIDQYIAGEHASHQVLPLTKAYPRIKDLLFYQQKQLEEAVNKFYLQTEKLTHCKGMLNDVFNANVIKIKIGFEQIKEEAVRKQMEVLDYYQNRIYEFFQSIDEDISQNKKSIQLCKNHMEWIDGNLIQNAQNCLNTSIAFEVVNYFILNHHKIQTLSQKAHHSNILYLMQQLQENRKMVNLQDQKQIQKYIRNLQIIKQEDKSATNSTCSLSPEYFQAKRKEVFSQSHQDPPSKFIKLQHTTSMQRLENIIAPKTQWKKMEGIKRRLKGLF